MPSPFRPERTREFHEIRDPYSLATTYLSCKADLQAARVSGDDQIIPEWSAKLATLERWLLACFETSDGVDAVHVAEWQAVIRPIDGRIIVTSWTFFDLPFVAMPADPEIVPHPDQSNAGSVTFCRVA